MSLDSILAQLDGQRETIVSLQRLLVSTPALGPENGGDGERIKADKIKAFLAAFGLTDCTEYQAPDSRVSCGHRPNLAYVIKGDDTSRTFWVIAHMDVVPAGDLSLWKTNPFELTVDGDILYGRGVEDNHQGLVSGVLLAKALIETDSKPPVNFGLLFVADEETGNDLGLRYMAQQHADLFKQDDLILVPDSGTPTSEQIEVAEKSILWLKITIHGKQCHASRPQDGVNTLKAAASFILRTDEIKKAFDDQDPLFDNPSTTIEPTKKEANVPSVNIIPGSDVFYLDCRILPHYKVDDVMAEIKRVGASVCAEHGVTIDYEIVQRMDAAPVTPVSSPIVQRLIPAIKEEYGTTPRPEGIGGGTVAAILRHLGLPVVVWSTLFENPHQPNEKGSISHTLRDAKVMARVLFS